MNFINKIRKIEMFRFYISLFFVGILFIVLSGIIISQPKPEYLTAEGTINLIETKNHFEDIEYNVYISYTDKNGIIHEKLIYPSYSSSMKVGDKVTVLYEEKNPELIQAPGSEYIPYIILVIGIIVILIPIVKYVLDNKNKDVIVNSPFENHKKEIDSSKAEKIKNDNKPINEYYFHFTGKLNQSYILETPKREPIYEANCDHIGFFTPYRYTFINRKTGTSIEHKISHTITKSYGNEFNNLEIVSNSHFKIDDIDNWEYLDNLDYSIELKRKGLKINFDVLHHGVVVAHLEAAGVNILKDDSKSKLGDKLPANGLYKVSCKESDIEAVFFICFCVSRVEFF